MTLDEMAKELGVSKSTVSRALSGKGRIGAQTRQRIRQFVQEQQDGSIREADKETKTGNLGFSFPDDIFLNAFWGFMRPPL